MTVSVRFDYPTKQYQNTNKNLYCTHNGNSSEKHHGQLVRMLFQLEELSTAIQKEKELKLCIRKTLLTSLTHIRLDTDA